MILKKVFGVIGIAIAIISCQPNVKQTAKEQITIGEKTTEVSPTALGKTLFHGKGRCFSCHKTNKKSIGPSLSEIIKVYAEKNGNLIAFLKQEQEPIVDPENYAVMKTNFSLLKTFSDQELNALVSYMQDITKQ